MISPYLIIKYCKGICSNEEQTYIEQKIGQSEDARNLVDKYLLLMNLTDDIVEMESIDSHSAYLAVLGKAKKQQRRSKFRTKVLQIAAAMAFPLLACSLTLGYMLYKDSKKENLYTEVSANPGTIVKHGLPDKSTVWLNSNSKIRYTENFSGGNRSIELLNGEVFLDIEADETNPFFINTPEGMTVYVYGTKFNVRNYENENLIETTLMEGKVNLILNDNKEPLILTPGESAIYNKENRIMQKSAVNVSDKTSWRNGQLIFRNTSLENILEELSRHFDTRINYVNNKGINYRYRATFTNESMSEILDILSQSALIEWEIVDDPLKVGITGEKPKMINVHIY